MNKLLGILLVMLLLLISSVSSAPIACWSFDNTLADSGVNEKDMTIRAGSEVYANAKIGKGLVIQSQNQ